VKYAFYSSPNEYSVWTTTDARIDSMETTIPFELLGKVKDWTNFDEVGPNYNYFEEEDKEQNNKSKKLVSMRPLRHDMDEPIEATLDRMIRDEGDEDEMRPNDPQPISVDMSVTFQSDTFESVEEVNQITESYGEELIDVSVDIRNHGEQMVGMNHNTHGSITEQGERTWDNPYPNGIGGGFNIGGDVLEEMDGGMMERAIPADEETVEAMGIEFDERDSYGNSDELHTEH